MEQEAPRSDGQPGQTVTESTEVPLRTLNEFAIVNSSGNTPVSLLELPTLPAGTVFAIGSAPPIDGQPVAGNQKSIFLQTSPLTDWVIHYGPSPGIWICTEKAWYKLLNPSAAYAPLFAAAQRRLDLCVRAVACMKANPAVNLQASIAALLQPSTAPPPGSSDARYSPEDLRNDTPFLVLQLAGWLTRTRAAAPPLLVELQSVAKGVIQQRVQQEAAAAQAAAQAAATTSVGAGRGRKPGATPSAGPKRKRNSITGEEEVVEEEMDTRMPVARGRGRGAGGGRGRGAALGNASALRSRSVPPGGPLAGPAPTAAEFDAVTGDEEPDPAEYDEEDDAGEAEEGDSEQSGGEEADMDPAEREDRRYARWQRRVAERRQALDAARGEPPAPVADWRVDPDMVPEVLAVWEMLMTFAFMLQLPPVPMRALEAALMPGPLPLRNPDGSAQEAKAEDGGVEPLYDARTLVDHDYVASAALLRDVHAGLLRMVDGHAPRRQELPQESKLMAEEVKTENWVERVASAINGASPDVVSAEAKAAAETLKTREYVLLPPRAKLAVLRGLVELALASDVLREHINARIEMLAVPLRVLAGGEEAGYSRALQAAVQPVAPAGPAEAEDPDFWIRWMDSCKLGMRKPVGTDARGRRYWALGANAGAWRVYVEADGGRSWGWYEGDGLRELVEWLRAGRLAREGPLIRILQSIPQPKKLNEGPVPEAGEVEEEELAAASIPWAASDYEARRASGYRSIVAPLLRGNLNMMPHQPGVPRVALHVEDRMCHAIETLIGEVDYWLQAPAWAARIGELLDRLRQLTALRKAKGADGEGANGGQPRYNGADVVLAVEELLCKFNVMRAPWLQQLRDPWVASLREPAHGPREVALHILAMQQFATTTESAFVLTRAGFMRRVSEARCPLFFPGPSDHVVLCRTGIYYHIEKYASMAKATGDMAWLRELAGMKERVNALHCAQRYRVACLSYRTYPLLPPHQQPAPPPVKLEGDGSGEPVVPAAVPSRPPCMWMLLTPLRAQGLGRFEQATGEVVLPLYIENTLPDFVIKTEVFDRTRSMDWSAGDRVRMYVGGKQGAKVSGSWYRGKIVHIGTPPAPDQQDFDPWDSIAVEWDKGGGDNNARNKVCPWDIEIDVEAQKRMEDERRRLEEEALRAQRVTAKAQREAAAVVAEVPEEDDDEYVPTEDSESDDDSDDSDGGGAARRRARRGRSGRGGRGKREPTPSAQQQQQQPGGHPPNMTTAQAQQYMQQRQIAMFQQQQQLRQGGGAMPAGVSPQLLAHLQTLAAPQQMQLLREMAARGGAAQQQAVLLQQALVQQQQQAALLQQRQQQQQQQQAATDQQQALLLQQRQQQLLLQQQQQQQQQQAALAQRQLAATLAALTSDEFDNGRPCARDLFDPQLAAPRGGYRGRINNQQLQLLPQQRDAFHVMLLNWYRARQVLRYRLPRVAGVDIDLRKLFVNVHMLGGYDTVCVNKLWAGPDLCREQGFQPNHPASNLRPQQYAAHALRNAYEQCLLDFEDYCTSGILEQDAAAGRTLPHDRLLDVPGAPAVAQPSRGPEPGMGGGQYGGGGGVAVHQGGVHMGGGGGQQVMDVRLQQQLLMQQQMQAQGGGRGQVMGGYGQGQGQYQMAIGGGGLPVLAPSAISLPAGGAVGGRGDAWSAAGPGSSSAPGLERLGAGSSSRAVLGPLPTNLDPSSLPQGPMSPPDSGAAVMAMPRPVAFSSGAMALASAKAAAASVTSSWQGHTGPESGATGPSCGAKGKGTCCSGVTRSPGCKKLREAILRVELARAVQMALWLERLRKSGSDASRAA